MEEVELAFSREPCKAGGGYTSVKRGTGRRHLFLNISIFLKALQPGSFGLNIELKDFCAAVKLRAFFFPGGVLNSASIILALLA